MKKFILTTSVGVVMGGVLGFAYWYYVGCASGSCAITSSPVNSSLYGMLMGGILISSGLPGKKQKQINHS